MTGLIIDNLFDSMSIGLSKTLVEPQEDLGFANNIVRMRGGFFTGCFIKWSCSIPFIPVDTTVNACGVSVFKLDEHCSCDQFKKRCINGFSEYSEYDFNFTNGNHFVALCTDDEQNSYLVIHASDKSFKFGENGLYPYENTWFLDKIKTYEFGERYIRYLIGNVAEKFYDIYKRSEYLNPIRNRELCSRIIGNGHWIEVLYSPHYGMPDSNSVAIGCQWKKGNKVLLTAPGNDIFVFKGDDSVKYPHGLGMVKPDLESIHYSGGELFINDKKVSGTGSYISNGKLVNRLNGCAINEDTVRCFLHNKVFDPFLVLHQQAAWTRNGYSSYDTKSGTSQ